MKKLMLMPLMAGVVWVCSASPVQNPVKPYEVTFSNMKINESLLKEIFTEAVPLFKDQYGIVTTVVELQTGYDVGTVIVNKITGSNSFTVTRGGNTVLVDFGDYF